MEIFIKIPFVKQTSDGGILKIAKTDFSESIRFIRKEKPVVGKALLVICGINLFLSAMMIVALPYLVTEVLNLEAAQAMSFVQAETPQYLIGKVIAVILTVAMCAQPLCNALYGVLFEICKGFEYTVVLFSGVVSLIIAISTRNIFS